MPSTNGGGNSRKIGRHTKFAALYLQQGRLARNKARTLARHIKRMAKKAARLKARVLKPNYASIAQRAAKAAEKANAKALA